MNQDPRLARVIDLYQRLDSAHLHLLAEVYAESVLFEDPAHRIQGRPALTAYFAHLYQAVTQIDFDIHTAESAGEHGWLSWTMTLRHPRLAAGAPVAVSGATRLTFDGAGQVSHHRDYFDLGALLYERLPLLGPLVRAIKGRFGT